MKFKIQRKYLSLGIILLVLIISYFPLFYNLDELHIRMWDEAIYANNSIEMATNHNLFVVQHEGKPDLFNTKPPFVIWLQAISISFFGINELAIRLPSAIFGLFTVLIIFIFCVKVIKQKVTGLFSILILLTSKGYVGYHVTRTGDLDVFLVFWLVFYSFLFIAVLIQPRFKPKHYLPVLSIGVILAFLTKGIAGFFFLPLLMIITFLFGNHKIYRNKLLYIYAFFTLLVCSSYYILREILSPGYLEMVINFEIFRITDVVASWQVHSFDFYIWHIVDNFYPYYYLVPLTILSPFFFKFGSDRFKISIYLLILLIGYFLLISYPPVKLEWYDAPLYPIMAILIGLTLNQLINLISNLLKPGISKKVKYTLISIILLAIFTYPYRTIINSFKYPENIYGLEMDGAYLRYLKNAFPDIKDITIFKIEPHNRIYDQVLFYKKAFEKQHSYLINISSDSSFKEGEYVIVSKNELKYIVENNYTVTEINNWKSGTLFKIISRKP